MRRPAILQRYIFFEITASFFFSFAVFLMAGLVAGFLPLLQKGMEAGLQLTLILFQVLINALPSTLVTVLPLSIVMGALLGLGRMSADNEIAAIKSAGISIVKLLPPVLFLGIIGTLMSFYCTMSLIPHGISEGKRLIRNAAATRVDAGLEERTFFDSIKNLVIYVEKIDSDSGVLSRIFIQEKSQPDETRTIVAQKGKISPDPDEKSLVLDLKNGTIVKENQLGETTGGLAFESYSFRFPIERQDMDSAKTLEEMSLGEIRSKILNAREKEKTADSQEFIDYYNRVTVLGKMLIVQRFTYPLACLALAFAAFPVGILNLGKSRLNNVSMGLVLIFAYYALTLTVERMARSSIAPPEFALPTPPILFMIMAAYLTNKVRLENLELNFSWATRFIKKALFRSQTTK